MTKILIDEAKVRGWLDTFVEINKLSVGENAICLPAEIDTAMDEMRQALEQPVPAQPLTDVIKAAQGVLEWTEIAHRPPVRDQLEAGRMVMVRLHSLADLHDALAAHGITKGNT